MKISDRAWWTGVAIICCLLLSSSQPSYTIRKTSTVNNVTNNTTTNRPVESIDSPSKTSPLIRLIEPIHKGSKIFVQHAEVITEQADLRTNHEADSHILAHVGQGRRLFVVADMGDHWGVLMKQRVIGWVPKNQLRLLDFQEEIDIPGSNTAEK